MTYTALSSEYIYDVAAKLYSGDTSLGIQDLLTLNPGINPNIDLVGTVLIYTAGLRRTTPIAVSITPIIAAKPVYLVGTKQTIYDLACQLFGNAQKLTDLINAFPDLNNEITVGSPFSYTPSIDPIALLFTQRRVIVATSTGISNKRLLETASFRLLETGGFRILET